MTRVLFMSSPFSMLSRRRRSTRAVPRRGDGHAVDNVVGHPRRSTHMSLLHYPRSDLKPARTSSEKSWGCSQAAKWPPLATLLKWNELGIRLLRPAPRRLVKLVREDAHRHRDGDALGGQVIERVLTVEGEQEDTPVFVSQKWGCSCRGRRRASGLPARRQRTARSFRGCAGRGRAAWAVRPTGESAIPYSVCGRERHVEGVLHVLVGERQHVAREFLVCRET